MTSRPLRQPYLVLATFNIGDHGTLADARNLFHDRGAHAVLFQEASDRAALLSSLERAGFGVFDGFDKLGQAATPIAWDPRFLKPRRGGAFCYPMVDAGDPRLRGEAGAGPEQLKPKWIVGHSFTHLASGRLVHLGSTHVVPSVYVDKRRALASQHLHRAAVAFPKRGLPFLGGDFNIDYPDGLLAPMADHGWRNTHQVLGALNTHEKRTIDYLWFKDDDRVEVVDHATVRTGSDHEALVAAFRLTPRRLRLPR